MAPNKRIRKNDATLAKRCQTMASNATHAKRWQAMPRMPNDGKQCYACQASRSLSRREKKIVLSWHRKKSGRVGGKGRIRLQQEIELEAQTIKLQKPVTELWKLWTLDSMNSINSIVSMDYMVSVNSMDSMKSTARCMKEGVADWPKCPKYV